MSPVQIVRTVAVALIAGGGALGLIPSGSCGAGWWAPVNADSSYGWFGYGDGPTVLTGSCGTSMAPVGSWAIALIVVGAALLAGALVNTRAGRER